jgi:hypothetical protein
MATVYVSLSREGTIVWRPVDAAPIRGNQFQIDPSAVIPEGESWEFQPGVIVVCEWRQLSNGRVLVAIARP